MKPERRARSRAIETERTGCLTGRRDRRRGSIRRGVGVAAVLSWATLIGMDLSAFPKTQAWLGRCTARPGYARLISKMG